MAAHRTLSKHSLVALVGVALAGAAAWWWQQPASAQGQPAASSAATVAKAAPKAPAPVSVEVAPVQRRSVQDQAQAVGSLLSRQSVVLRPEVGGRVVALAFEDGQRVRRGQTLVRLDDQLQRAQVRQAQAEAGVAQTNHQRNQELVAQGFISQRSLDESAAALEVAQAKLALAQAQLERLRITAPFDGTLGIRQVAVGDYLKDGANIVNLEDMDALYVDFRLPERYQRLLRPGGLVMNHGITSSDAHNGETRYGGGQFIGRYVFPQGELPHIGTVMTALQEGGLEPFDAESLRRHYARTLQCWSEAFEAKTERLKALVPEKTWRIWRMYLVGCQWAFEHDELSLFQVLCRRAGQPAATLPWSRRWVYGGAR